MFFLFKRRLEKGAACSCVTARHFPWMCDTRKTWNVNSPLKLPYARWWTLNERDVRGIIGEHPDLTLCLSIRNKYAITHAHVERGLNRCHRSVGKALDDGNTSVHIHTMMSPRRSNARLNARSCVAFSFHFYFACSCIRASRLHWTLYQAAIIVTSRSLFDNDIKYRFFFFEWIFFSNPQTRLGMGNCFFHALFINVLILECFVYFLHPSSYPA